MIALVDAVVGFIVPRFKVYDAIEWAPAPRTP
jgi:hypothetical protein